ncbi:MAG: helix-turn-helix transcriptional regulator [Lachnospiraceae bacterium]|nr:helix-turn-helix transcriptional regulator [Lachnospiraceae bacterium]
MENILFHSDNEFTRRIIYTPSNFTKKNLIHLQETGMHTALEPEISERDSLSSFLFFIVTDGSGEINCDNTKYSLSTGDCVFIDCLKPYYHKTTTDPWTIKWVHFTGPAMKQIYDRLMERNDGPVFTPPGTERYVLLLDELFHISSESDSIRDMKIYERLISLLTCIMEDCTYPEPEHKIGKRKDIAEIISYIDQNFKRKISLDELSNEFFVNKFYLTRIFKEETGQSITEFILNKRITYAKSLLRFSDQTLEEIGEAIGIGDAGYFSKTFKKIEGITPGEYRKLWR